MNIDDMTGHGAKKYCLEIIASDHSPKQDNIYASVDSAREDVRFYMSRNYPRQDIEIDNESWGSELHVHCVISAVCESADPRADMRALSDIAKRHFSKHDIACTEITE